MSNNKYCIVGAGGSAKETLICLLDIYKSKNKELKTEDVIFLVPDNEFKSEKILGYSTLPQSKLNTKDYQVVIGVGDSKLRDKISKELPEDTTYCTLIHPTAQIGESVKIGAGSVITAGCILTCDIQIGQHAQLNLNTTISHDAQIGDYFTTAPGVNINGNATIKDRVYIGSQTALKQGLNICSDVIVGLGSGVIKSISEPGTYVGTPATLIKK